MKVYFCFILKHLSIVIQILFSTLYLLDVIDFVSYHNLSFLQRFWLVRCKTLDASNLQIFIGTCIGNESLDWFLWQE